MSRADAEARRQHDARIAYGKALTASMPAIEELAADPEADGAELHHRRPGDARPWPPPAVLPPIPPDARQIAREAGWLVAALDDLGSPGVGRLAGLDVAVKDLIDVAGLPVRNGTPGGLWRDPSTSAPAWSSLARAGARCVGKAATHELAWGVTTPAIGNPHDLTRYAGGSSGGSGACVASGAAHGALGTDTGGSIRVPAALCGVVGIRPTHGSVDPAGVTPMAPSQDVVGPLARDVTTCAVMLEELTGRPVGPPEERRRRRIGVLVSPGALDADVAAAYARTRSRLADRGVEIVEIPRIPLRESGALSLVTMVAESAALHAEAVAADPEGFGPEVRGILSVGRRLLEARGPDDVTTLLRRGRHALRVRTEELFAEHRIDAFLTPTTPCVAPLRGRPTVRLGERDVPVSAALSRFTAWSAAAGWPAISVPVPAGPLPVGIQLMARPWREDLCLALGELAQSP